MPGGLRRLQSGWDERSSSGGFDSRPPPPNNRSSPRRDQRLARSIGSVVPFAVQRAAVESGSRVARRPFARLRRPGSAVSASAAEIRWTVDHRASRCPFSRRDMSACGIPDLAASSSWVQPSSNLRSRMESPRRASSPMADQIVTRQVYVPRHIVVDSPGRTARRGGDRHAARRPRGGTARREAADEVAAQSLRRMSGTTTTTPGSAGAMTSLPDCVRVDA